MPVVRMEEGIAIFPGRVGVSPAGDRVSRSRTLKDCFGKMPKPAGETPILLEKWDEISP